MTRPAEYWKKRAEANMDRVQEGAEQHLARLVSHATPDLRGMLQAMDTVWAGGNYSTRIWKNTERLAETLSSEIEAAFLSGKSVRRMADTIMERFGVGYRAAECLVRTETSYVQNQTAARSYEDAGCTEYEILTASDRRTCRRCAGQNGKRYLFTEMQAGENAPPFHPNCRCTVLPVVEEGTETGKAEAAKQEEIGFAVATTGKSGIIKADRVISGHSTTPRKAEPNVVIDHVDENGSVDARGFYDADGLKERDIHTTDHGNPKRHPYGEHGEHGHDYQWNTDGSLKRKATRELTDTERKENSDIL